MGNIRPSTISKLVLIEAAAQQFFETSEAYGDTTRKKFARSLSGELGRCANTVKCVFSRPRWQELRHSWLIDQLRLSMDEVYRDSIIRSDFNIPRIIKKIKVGSLLFRRLLVEEWHERAATLPTAQEYMLAKLREMVDANVPVAQLTFKNLYQEAGVCPDYGPWIAEPLRIARLELEKRQRNQAIDPPPCSINVRAIPGGFIDLDGDVWDFKIVGRPLLRKDLLRRDIAAIAWPLLVEEISARELVITTIYSHYRAFLWMADLLGKDVPDVREADLQGVQRAWARDAPEGRRSQIRWALVRIFTAIHSLIQKGEMASNKEILGIIGWLVTKVKLRNKKIGGDFLSESELDKTITCCLIDIESGCQFASSTPKLSSMSSRSDTAGNASSIIRMTTALMILTMVFTGLRRKSIIDLDVTSSVQISPVTNGIIWQHPKTAEEKIVITPKLIIRLIDYYLELTDEIRRALDTRRVFITGSRGGQWSIFHDGNCLNGRLAEFTERHELKRHGSVITLTATMLRRTYATHQLNKGRSLWFVKSQYGHTSIKTTEGYAQFSKYEHPDQVGRALDTWGEKVLDLWREPVMLEELTPSDRALLFTGKDASAETDLDSDFCPCSSCEHLSTGHMFSDMWEIEREARKQRLAQLETEHPLSERLAREKAELLCFEENYALMRQDNVKERKPERP